MTIIDLRMQYKRETGDPRVPISYEHYADVAYIIWLEEQLIKHMELKKKLIPWEKLS